jgi:tetratricopeptide (TPR) repeat protein
MASQAAVFGADAAAGAAAEAAALHGGGAAANQAAALGAGAAAGAAAEEAALPGGGAAAAAAAAEYPTGTEAPRAMQVLDEDEETRTAAAQRGGGASTSATGEECAICLDTMQRPQALRCGHRFCCGCVRAMRHFSAGQTQVCPLCRAPAGPMPDAERRLFKAVRMMVRCDGWEKVCPTMPEPVRRQLERAAGLLRTVARELGADSGLRADTFMSLGYVLEQLGEDEDALSTYHEAIKADPDRTGPRINHAILLNRRGDAAGAAAALRAVTQMDPRCAAAHLNLGCVLGERGDYAAAEESFSKAAHIDPLHRNAQKYREKMRKQAAESGQRGEAGDEDGDGSGSDAEMTGGDSVAAPEEAASERSAERGSGGGGSSGAEKAGGGSAATTAAAASGRGAGRRDGGMGAGKQ